MKIPILSGIFTDNGPDLRISYPVNMAPVAQESGVSAGYLRPADGLVANGTGPGVCRGGINWNGTLYRVMGSKLILVSPAGGTTVLGDVGDDGEPVTLDYGYVALPSLFPTTKPQVLIIASNNNLFYYDGANLTQVIDPSLGNVIDAMWIDGYVLTTDGEFIVSTSLSDGLSVLPGSYEATDNDPDPIVALVKLHNEVYALNRYTIQVLANTGAPSVGTFTFSIIDGGKIMRGCIGTHACCRFLDNIAFLGSGRGEAPGIFFGANSSTEKISTREIDKILQGYSESQLSQAVMEPRNSFGHQHLYLHLPDRTIVFDADASQKFGQPVWFTLTSSTQGFGQYRGKYMVWCYDDWTVSDTSTASIGVMDEKVGSHWGDTVRWEFGTAIIYNEGNGALFNELELVCLAGRVAVGVDTYISTSYSTDGLSWSQDRAIKAGTTGQTNKRFVWFQQGHMRNWRIQRFRGDSQAHLSFVRLEAQLEGLAY